MKISLKHSFKLKVKLLHVKNTQSICIYIDHVIENQPINTIITN